MDEVNLFASDSTGPSEAIRVGPVSVGPQGVAVGYPMAPPREAGIFTRPVLVGAGVGFLARGVTGAIIGAILGSFWTR